VKTDNSGTRPEGRVPDAQLALAIGAELAGAHRRIARIEAGGAAYWLKRAERPNLLWRLRKGDGRRAFEADRAALKRLAGADLPVPAIVAEGPDHFVLPDLGRPLAAMLRFSLGSAGERLAACTAAGAALAALHRAGFSHGRPSLRDMIWDGAGVWLIDFERFRDDRNCPAGFAEDLLLAVHSMIAYAGDAGPALGAFIAAYRAQAPDAVWEQVRRRARRLRLPARVAAIFAALRPGSRELRAFPAAVAFLSSVSGG